MPNMKLAFSDIDYAKTLSALFPRLLSALEQSTSDNFAVRLLQKIGHKSERAVLDILSRLPNEQKNDIVIAAFRMERARIIKELSDALHQNEYGRHISFEDAFLMPAPNGQIECWLENVSIDYQALARRITPAASALEALPPLNDALPSSFRRTALRAAGYAARATGALMNLGIGDAALSHFLKREDVADTLNKTLEAMLAKNGIFAKVRGCEFFKGEHAVPQEVISLNQSASVPAELIDTLLDVLSSYLIELIDQTE